jgi:hypothetical protein
LRKKTIFLVSIVFTLLVLLITQVSANRIPVSESYAVGGELSTITTRPFLFNPIFLSIILIVVASLFIGGIVKSKKLDFKLVS